MSRGKLRLVDPKKKTGRTETKPVNRDIKKLQCFLAVTETRKSFGREGFRIVITHYLPVILQLVYWLQM